MCDLCNTYAAGEAVGLLRAIYAFHTGPERRWPDVAYNFFVDRFGTVYEGRTGSLAGAVASDASGGSQGLAQLCAFVGDHSTVPPTEAALAAMAGLLGFLGEHLRVEQVYATLPSHGAGVARGSRRDARGAPGALRAGGSVSAVRRAGRQGPGRSRGL